MDYFWIPVELHPLGNPKASQLLDLDELRPLFKSLAIALLKYYELTEHHLKEFQLHVYGELMDHLSYPTRLIKLQLWLTLISHTPT